MVVPIPSSLKQAATHVVGVRGKTILRYAALQTRSALGVEPFTSVYGLDRAVLPLLPKHGFFVEAGAQDGFTSSNTYYLERQLGWTGLLVEPIPQLAAFARRTRRVPVINAALGAPENEGRVVELTFADGMSRIDGGVHMKWAGLFGRNPTRVPATLRTLSGILEEAGNPSVDFLSIDVEGYELDVLSGLDLARHAPRLIIVESNHPRAVAALLPGYAHIGSPTPGDHLFRREAGTARPRLSDTKRSS